jgi:hypothetical protein
MSSFKKNIWMYGVIGVFVFFIGLMTFFATMAAHVKVDLVVKDYYRSEIAYQSQVTKLKNTNALALKPAIILNTNKQLVLDMKDTSRYASLEGKLTLYRPDDPKRDTSFALQVDKAGRQQFDVSSLHNGHWIMKLDWQEDGVGYYMEQAIKL